MEFTINVTVGVTPELGKLMSAFVGMAKAETVAVEAPKKPAKALKEAKPDNVAAEDEKVAEKQKEEAKQPEEVKEEKPTAPEAKTSYTEEDIRQAMHECRVRFEGSDYKTNTTGEGYKKHHKNLTQWFKNQAALLGADKPSELPAEMRPAFIEVCARTIEDTENGGYTL